MFPPVPSVVTFRLNERIFAVTRAEGTGVYPGKTHPKIGIKLGNYLLVLSRHGGTGWLLIVITCYASFPRSLLSTSKTTIFVGRCWVVIQLPCDSTIGNYPPKPTWNPQNLISNAKFSATLAISAFSKGHPTCGSHLPIGFLVRRGTCSFLIYASDFFGGVAVIDLQRERNCKISTFDWSIGCSVMNHHGFGWCFISRCARNQWISSDHLDHPFGYLTEEHLIQCNWLVPSIRACYAHLLVKSVKFLIFSLTSRSHKSS